MWNVNYSGRKQLRTTFRCYSLLKRRRIRGGNHRLYFQSWTLGYTDLLKKELQTFYFTISLWYVTFWLSWPVKFKSSILLGLFWYQGLYCMYSNILSTYFTLSQQHFKCSNHRVMNLYRAQSNCPPPPLP